jgi:hypothetical protein
MGWAAVVVVGLLFVAPFLLAVWFRERAFRASALVGPTPYDWAHEDDLLGMHQERWSA